MDADILIVGAGLVGASLAVALRGARWRMLLTDLRAMDNTAGDQTSWDSRIYAVSPASRIFLQTIGVWQQLDATRISPIHRMRVFGDRGTRLTFSAYETGVEALAWMVESDALAGVLGRLLDGQPNLALCCPARPSTLSIDAHSVELSLEGGRKLRSRLLIGADGAQSFVRQAAGVGDTWRSYEQMGVVANFSCELPHGSTAMQWFRDDGVLAYLPLPGNRVSIVWSTGTDHALDLMALDQTAFCRRVVDAGERSLGELELLTRPAAFPLSMMAAGSLIARRTALIGDAAHLVHPLAGQGVNLGFGDAEVLGRLLATTTLADPGLRQLLRQFERARAADILTMRVATDGLSRLFASRIPGAGLLRNLGMSCLDRLLPLKNQLASLAMAPASPLTVRP